MGGRLGQWGKYSTYFISSRPSYMFLDLIEDMHKKQEREAYFDTIYTGWIENEKKNSKL